MATVPNPVLMRHPSAPGEEVEVDESTVDHWRTLGWAVAGETTAEAKKAREAAEKAAARAANVPAAAGPDESEA